MQIARNDQSLLDAARVLTANVAVGRSRILVIDHNPDQQWRAARTLTLAGHRVIGTSSVSGAVALLSECRVDLVLLAETIPGIDVADLAQRIRCAQPGVPIHVVSDTVVANSARDARLKSVEPPA